MNEKTIRRLNYIGLVAPYGTASISFYDYIRIYIVKSLLDFEYIMNIPLNFKLSTKELNWDYKLIAKTITYNEFLLYTDLKVLLLNQYCTALSLNPYIPIHFILLYQSFNWSWYNISWKNSTISFKDLITHHNKFSIQDLSGNSSIPVDWLLELYTVDDLNWISISCRLTIHELKYLYFDPRYHDYLVWSFISGNNPNISLSFIVSHPEYPWIYNQYYHPNIKHFKQYYDQSKLNVLARSNNLDLTDLDITDSDYLNLYTNEFFSSNCNLTLKICQEYRLFIRKDPSNLIKYNLMDQPLLTDHYKNLYKSIICELKYY